MNYRHDTENDTAREMLPAYGMGITDEAEARDVEVLLAHQPELAAEADQYRQLAGALLADVPQIEAPPHLLDKVFDAPAAPARIITFPGHYAITAAAAVVVLLLVVNVFALLRINTLQDTQHNLATQVEAQVALLSLFADDDITRFVLPDVRENGGDARAVILCNLADTVGLLRVENFPVLPSEQAYQVWLTRGSTRISGGLFQVDSEGKGVFIVSAPTAMGDYDTLGITIEPAAGSNGPTSPPVVRGSLYADDLH